MLRILAWATEVSSTPLKKQNTATEFPTARPMRYRFLTIFIFCRRTAMTITTVMKPNRNLERVNKEESMDNPAILDHLIITVAR